MGCTETLPTRWLASILVLSVLGLANGFVPSDHLPENYLDEFPIDEENIDDNSLQVNSYEDEKLEKIGNMLANLLISPWPHGVSPILYVENNPVPFADPLVPDNSELEESFHPAPPKRSRYYRKYPWKRQNSRYEPGNRFICTPSKDDVYRLLVALHEARQGNKERMVNFCNRKRPAYAIYTNIRFLGK